MEHFSPKMITGTIALNILKMFLFLRSVCMQSACFISSLVYNASRVSKVFVCVPSILNSVCFCVRTCWQWFERWRCTMFRKIHCNRKILVGFGTAIQWTWHMRVRDFCSSSSCVVWCEHFCFGVPNIFVHSYNGDNNCVACGNGFTWPYSGSVVWGYRCAWFSLNKGANAYVFVAQGAPTSNSN